MQTTSTARRPVPMAFPHVFTLPSPLIGIAYLAGYVMLDWVSYIQPFGTFGITPWNPPTGLSFIVVLLFGRRFIPLLFVAPLLADLFVRHMPFPFGFQLLVSAVIGGSYSVGLLFLTRTQTRFNPALASMRDLLVLLGVAGLSAALMAIGHVGVLVAAGYLPVADFLHAALRDWVGDMIGITVVAPFALILLTRGSHLRWPEFAAQVAAIAAALVLVFFYADSHHFPLFYLLFLPTIWMAVRGGLDTVTVGILLTQLGLIGGVQLQRTSDIDVTQFQALMLVLALTGLVAGALVTEHRRTEMQLRLHQDSVARIARLGSAGELAAAVAHEINQPLMAAGTYTRLVAETLGSDAKDDAKVVETARKAAAQVQRAAEVVRRLRALIRLDQSGRAPASVERIVAETIEMSQPDLDRNGVMLTTRLEAPLPPVIVDLLQVEQVLLNLVRNSAEAIRESGASGGRIVLRAYREGDGFVGFEVSDNGPGFPPGFEAGEFPPLSSTKAEGLGIGLSLCRSIVEAHGGRLSLGGGPDGAVVRLALPAATGARA